MKFNQLFRKGIANEQEVTEEPGQHDAEKSEAEKQDNPNQPKIDIKKTTRTVEIKDKLYKELKDLNDKGYKAKIRVLNYAIQRDTIEKEIRSNIKIMAEADKRARDLATKQLGLQAGQEFRISDEVNKIEVTEFTGPAS